MPKHIIRKVSTTPEEKLCDLLAYTTNTNGCCIWKGAVNSDGYAAMFNNVKVHRLVYLLAKGYYGGLGTLIRHSCDNPLCINPEHLLLGTHQENMNDKFVRNRQPRVVTKEIVFKVRELLKENMKQKDIALQLGIDARRVSDISVGLYNDAGKFVRKGG